MFGTKHELRRSFRAPDLFGKLADAFQGASGARTPYLKKLTLQGGFPFGLVILQLLAGGEATARILPLPEMPLSRPELRGAGEGRKQRKPEKSRRV